MPSSTLPLGLVPAEVSKMNRDDHIKTARATLNASYEVDLFEVKNMMHSMPLPPHFSPRLKPCKSPPSLVAELSNAWYTLGYKKESLALLENQLVVADKVISITTLKHQSGKNSITDVWQQEQYIASLKNQKTLLEADIDAQKRSINFLLGRSALSDIPLATKARLVTLPPQPEVGIPATKLLNRPDRLRQACRRTSSNASLAEAIKNQYPNLNVSLSLGSTKTVTVFDLTQVPF